MALIAECDRCHHTIKDGEVAVRGFVIQREYCSSCVEEIDEMQQEIDDCHDAMAVQWADKLALIRDCYNTEDGLLPDVPVE